ncbi:hypothetical protein FRC17_008952 [Serendipita sp. 399]|nr:hypothetical protein FRC17_008952 [Serendipita sp. 399]
MQFMKQLLGAGSGFRPPTSNTEELAQLHEGELYILRKNSAKGSRECIYTTALASVRRTETPFHYQLVITRAYQEGEAELLDDLDEEEEEEREFTLREELKPRVGSFEGNTTFIWRDLDEADASSSSSDENLYEFVLDGRRTDANTFSAFVEAVLRAMYEHKHGKSSEKLSFNQLQAMYQVETNLAPQQEQEPLPDELGVVRDDEYIDREEGELYQWSNELQGFVPPSFIQNPIEVRVVQTGQYEYFLIIKYKGNKILGHKVTDDMNGKGSTATRSFTWNHLTSKGEIEAWSILFPYPESYTRFINAMGQCIYEVQNAMDWSKIKDIDQEYVLTAMSEDVEMSDAQSDEAEVEDALAEESEDAEDESDQETPDWGTKNEKNSGLAVGHNGISVVLRGSNVGIFRETTDGKLELGGTVKGVKGPGKNSKVFSPNKMMLHEQDRALVLMNPDNLHALYRMDLETGKVVDEWKLHDNIAINAMTPVEKLAQLTGEQTLLGTSHNAIFRVDPRVSESNKLVESDMKQYVTKNKFSSITTTERGHIAVGSEKGEVRLFDTLGKNAKTMLPALGDAIRGIDVTKDGRWLIATCKTYLLLVDTQIGTGKYAGSSGFTRSFPADAKPKPKKLQLRPEHVAFMGAKIDFSPAKFNTGLDAKETAIITSNGPFVIAWNFAKVKKGILDSYEVKRYTGNVVEDNFSFGNDKDIIVTLQDDVLMLPKRHLQKPGGRKSLNQPVNERKSRNDIVNAPF